MAKATSFASPQMNWDAPDPITAFARFKQKCQLMFSSVLKDADDEEKVSYILLWSGEKGLDIYNSWTFTKEEILTISTIEVNTIEDTQHSTTHDTRA